MLWRLAAAMNKPKAKKKYIDEELQQMLNLLRLKNLKNTFSEKQKEYFKTENPDIKAELDALSDEIERLSSFNEE